MTRANSVNFSGLERYVVDPSAANGAYTTIQSAVDAASLAGGGCVYVQKGTYTETVTCKDLVSLAALGCDGQSQNVKVIGQLLLDTTAAAIKCSIQGLYVESAGAAPAVSVVGANGATVDFTGCSFSAVSGAAYNCTSGASFVRVDNCVFSASAGQKILNVSAGFLLMSNCPMSTTDTASTISGGFILCRDSDRWIETIDMTGGTYILIGGFLVIPATFPIAKVATGGNFNLYNTRITGTPSPTSGFIVDGNGIGTSGSFEFSGVVSGSATFIADPNLTIRPLVNLPSYPLVVSASQTMLRNSTYYVTSGTPTLTLPQDSDTNIGDFCKVALIGGTSWSIAQTGSQTIRLGSSITTAGVGGSVASTSDGDTVTLECVSSSGATNWVATSVIGALTIV